jgi:hypothetical protein
MCSTEIQGDPETSNVFGMRKHFKAKRKGVTNPGRYIHWALEFMLINTL